MRKEKGGKRAKKKMDERQEGMEKEGGEVEERTEERAEERTEERTEEGTEEREEHVKLPRKLAKNMRGVRKIQSSTLPREPGSVLHSLTPKKLQLWSL